MIDKLRAIKAILLNRDVRSSTEGEFECPVCGTKKVKMNPFPVYYFAEKHKYQSVLNPFFSETINFGHYSCAKCQAADRDRLYALYLNDYFTNTKTTIKLLDIAPSSALRKYLKNFSHVSYRSMDLFMEDVDDRLDITNMDAYAEEQFDFFICSHVLEHIPDDIKAMKELFRVLKKGGSGIAMVPINLEVKKTLEDPGCNDIAKRWKYFGQDDHVRVYAKEDFIDRLSSVGFKVEQLDINYFGSEPFTRNAIFPSSVLYIVKKL